MACLGYGDFRGCYGFDLQIVQIDVRYEIGIGLFHKDLNLALASASRDQIRSKFSVTGVSASLPLLNSPTVFPRRRGPT